MKPSSKPPQNRSDREDRQSWMLNFGVYGGVGFQLIGCIFAGVLGGNWLDEHWGTAPWLLLVGALLGIGIGFYNLFRIVTWKQNKNNSAR